MAHQCATALKITVLEAILEWVFQGFSYLHNVFSIQYKIEKLIFFLYAVSSLACFGWYQNKKRSFTLAQVIAARINYLF